MNTGIILQRLSEMHVSSKAENFHIGRRLESLEDLVKIQLENVTDEYMRGMANGLLIAWNVIAEPYGKEVIFVEAPKQDEK